MLSACVFDVPGVSILVQRPVSILQDHIERECRIAICLCKPDRLLDDLQNARPGRIYEVNPVAVIGDACLKPTVAILRNTHGNSFCVAVVLDAAISPIDLSDGKTKFWSPCISAVLNCDLLILLLSKIVTFLVLNPLSPVLSTICQFKL